MIVRKIDLWIGRQCMSAKRWIVVYSAIALGGGVLAWCGWWAFLGIPMLIIGVLGIVGHVRRL